MAYDREYREYVAKLIVDDGRVAREVAYELELSKSTVSRWVSDYRESLKQKHQPYRTQKEIEQLQKEQLKEIARLKEENEILKKAMHIFTQGRQ
ncbi:transposase [Sporolactobacillus sp. STCC-11]|uniref:transposase n=1 Tax=Sporolactobacillus caesalpiniae TaxID=3230362 RepID=UPI003398AF28